MDDIVKLNPHDQVNWDSFWKEAKEAGEEFMRKIKEKDDLTEFRNTGWGMYNAVADYISNAVPLRRSSVFEEKKLASFFDGNKLLDETQKIIMSA